jgi:hypothetical protein
MLVLAMVGTVWAVMPRSLARISQVAVTPALFLVDSGARLSDATTRILAALQQQMCAADDAMSQAATPWVMAPARNRSVDVR